MSTPTQPLQQEGECRGASGTRIRPAGAAWPRRSGMDSQAAGEGVAPQGQEAGRGGGGGSRDC